MARDLCYIDQSALTIANLVVREVVCKHGVPAQLLSDRGKAFLSDGLVERFNHTLTNMFKDYILATKTILPAFSPIFCSCDIMYLYLEVK